MGKNSNTSTTTTAPANASITDTTNKLLGGINSAYDKGPSVFNESLYAGLGGTTNQGLQSLIGSANNPAYSNGIQGAMESYGKTASGANIGQQDPGFAALRSKLQNDVTVGTNSSFNNSGLFGSDNNQQGLAQGLTDGLGALDYKQYSDSLDRQTQAAGMLPGLYQASQQPASTLLSAGAIQDADKQAALQGRYDLATRQGNAQTDHLAKLSSILAGNAAASGSTTTATTPQAPWWQQALGAAAIGSGIYGNVFK